MKTSLVAVNLWKVLQKIDKVNYGSDGRLQCHMCISYVLKDLEIIAADVSESFESAWKRVMPQMTTMQTKSICAHANSVYTTKK